MTVDAMRYWFYEATEGMPQEDPSRAGLVGIIVFGRDYDLRKVMADARSLAPVSVFVELNRPRRPTSPHSPSSRRKPGARIGVSSEWGRILSRASHEVGGILSAMKPSARTIGNSRLRELVETRKDDIGSLADRYGISNVRIFGSVARGDADARSDIDFLVDVPRDASLFDLSRFRRELSDLLGVDVDVVSSHALLPRDSDVLEEAIGL